MRVIDLGNGQEEYDDEIYDRRGGLSLIHI